MTKKTPTGMTRNEAMASMYMAGSTLQEIGDEHGVTRERVRQILASQGVSRRRPLDQAQRARIAAATAHGESILAEFRRSLSVRETVEKFSGVVPARVVRDVLRPVAHSQVLTRRGSDKEFSDDEIARAILEAERTGHTSVVKYSAWRASQEKKGRRIPSVATITVRHGSWSAARRRAGAGVVAERASASCRVFSDEEILAAVDRFVKAVRSVGSTPTARRYDEWSRKVGDVPLLSTVRARSGRSWSSLTREAVSKYS